MAWGSVPSREVDEDFTVQSNPRARSTTEELTKLGLQEVDTAMRQLS